MIVWALCALGSFKHNLQYVERKYHAPCNCDQKYNDNGWKLTQHARTHAHKLTPMCDWHWSKRVKLPPRGLGWVWQPYLTRCVCLCVDLNTAEGIHTPKVEAIWSWPSSEYIYINFTLHVMHKRWGNNCFNKSFMMSKLHLTNPFCSPITYCILIFRPLYIAETSKIQTNGDIGAITGLMVCV